MAFDQIDMAQTVIFAVGRQFNKVAVVAFCDLGNCDVCVVHLTDIYIFNLMDRANEIIERIVPDDVKCLFTG